MAQEQKTDNHRYYGDMGFFARCKAGWMKHRVGILGTVAIHLLVAIVFVSMHLETYREYSGSTLAIDFEREYEVKPIEADRERIALPADATQADREVEAIRNFTVDASAKDLNPALTDDKNINASALYDEANRLKAQMAQNKSQFEEMQQAGEEAIPNIPEKNTATDKEGQFKGPAVVSYFLEGRKAIRLPVPSYKCELGGQVVVDIEVSMEGRVVSANIDKTNSVNDDCITNAAVRAAFGSTFTASAQSSSRQKGSITYLFVPQ